MTRQEGEEQKRDGIGKEEEIEEEENKNQKKIRKASLEGQSL